ncbi:hypothetical protein DEO72_LG4g899 [Vigna unguiculata]|uniref:Uncharacterized protein n=1 Tax=Vigna unguiculata TaxID=3917 RepID=A0A4D6LMZ2_VIGUN|nr:hypothetical protein DEO72_LG4g899 [Vigna unguiculata]
MDALGILLNHFKAVPTRVPTNILQRMALLPSEISLLKCRGALDGLLDRPLRSYRGLSSRCSTPHYTVGALTGSMIPLDAGEILRTPFAMSRFSLPPQLGVFSLPHATELGHHLPVSKLPHSPTSNPQYVALSVPW